MLRKYLTLALLASTLACAGCGNTINGERQGSPSTSPPVSVEPVSRKDTSSHGVTTINIPPSQGDGITINGKPIPHGTNSDEPTKIIVNSPQNGGITVNGKSYPSGTITIGGSSSQDQVSTNDDSSFPGMTKGNGKVTSGSRAVSPFHQLVVNGSLDVYATVGPKTSVTVSGDSNILGLVQTKTQGGALTVETQGSYTTNNPLTVTIVTPSLDNISLNGSGNITAHALNAGQQSLNLNGSGNIDADGTVTTLSADLEGSGNINAQNMKAPQADVKLNGSGNVTVNATKSIKANLDGSGNIKYYGKPSSNTIQTNGSGSVSGV